MVKPVSSQTRFFTETMPLAAKYVAYDGPERLQQGLRRVGFLLS